MLGTATVSGIGFTLSLLIASLAFDGVALEQAKISVLAAALVSATLTAIVFAGADRLHDQSDLHIPDLRQ